MERFLIYTFMIERTNSDWQKYKSVHYPRLKNLTPTGINFNILAAPCHILQGNTRHARFEVKF